MLPVMAGQAKPNIVIIINDDMGYADIGCFGAPKINPPPVLTKWLKRGAGSRTFIWLHLSVPRHGQL